VQDDGGAGTAVAPAPGRVAASDPHAFAGLYIRHRSSFTSHARRYLRDPRDADEVVQEAFLRLFLVLPELETELQALAYCRRTITNLCIDRYRADARRPRLVALEGPTVDELAEDDSGDPVVRAEDAALVRAALAQLPALHRAALVKREIEEKPLPVIAEELDVAEDSVKHLLFRARKALRKLLAGTSVAPGTDVELSRGLRPAARGASGGVAGLLLLALLGLGSGPDLRAVPVVGVDLPDVLGVTTVADAVGDAFRDVVAAIVPGDEAHAEAHTDAGADEPASGSADVSPVPVGSGAEGGQAGVITGGAPDLVGTGQPTVVDGVPVTTVAPPTGALPTEDAPVIGGRPTVPGTATGGGSASLPAVLPPASSSGGAAAPGRPVAVPPAQSSDSRTSDRSPRADEVAQNVPDKAVGKPAGTPAGKPATVEKPTTTAKTAQKADKAAEQAAKKADKAAEQAAQKADKAAEQAAVQKANTAAQQATAQKADKAAEQAAKKAEQAAQKADKAAEQAAQKADKAAEQAAEKADKAAEKTAKADVAAKDKPAKDKPAKGGKS